MRSKVRNSMRRILIASIVILWVCLCTPPKPNSLWEVEVERRHFLELLPLENERFAISFYRPPALWIFSSKDGQVLHKIRLDSPIQYLSPDLSFVQTREVLYSLKEVNGSLVSEELLRLSSAAPENKVLNLGRTDLVLWQDGYYKISLVKRVGSQKIILWTATFPNEDFIKEAWIDPKRHLLVTISLDGFSTRKLSDGTIQDQRHMPPSSHYFRPKPDDFDTFLVYDPAFLMSLKSLRISDPNYSAAFSGGRLNISPISFLLFHRDHKGLGYTDVAFDRDKTYLLATTLNNELILWDFRTQEVIRTVTDLDADDAIITLDEPRLVIVHDTNNRVKAISWDNFLSKN